MPTYPSGPPSLWLMNQQNADIFRHAKETANLLTDPLYREQYLKGSPPSVEGLQNAYGNQVDPNTYKNIQTQTMNDQAAQARLSRLHTILQGLNYE